MFFQLKYVQFNKNISWKFYQGDTCMKLLQRLSVVLFLITLVACGDGSLEGGDNTSEEVNEILTSLTISISDTNVSEQNPATITAILSADGTAVEGEVITFSSSLGNFLPESGTALTGSNGSATIVLNSGDISGAGSVTASVSSGETATTGFTTQASSSVVLSLGDAEVSLAQVSAGGTSVISISIIDDQGDLYTEVVEFGFTSGCSQKINPTAFLSTPVTTSNGIATSTYLAQGCVGDDHIIINTVVAGVTLSATTTINVLSADEGSILYVSASPDTIVIKGTGGDESSTIVFRVLDVNGFPIENKDVVFELSTELGGISIAPLTATTNAKGEVQTVVNSGTVATSIKVKATIIGTNPIISSLSKQLVLSTGVPDQDSFDLSVDIANPEGWDISGTEVNVTARLADAFNNPVTDGTAVSFTTEGGSIDAFCTTLNGACSVIWRSQQPRPEGHILGDVNNAGHVPETANTMGQKYGGRATILATAIGEESFPDLNGNGRFDVSEVTAFNGTNISGLPYDLKEAFVDHNEDNFYNPGEIDAAEQVGGDLEGFTDFDNSGAFTQSDGLYNGVLCAESTHLGCSSEYKAINVRALLVLIMSGSRAEVETLTPAIEIVGESTSTGSVIISDFHNQPMPAGSKVSFTTSVGSIIGSSNFDWPNDNNNGGRQFTVVIKGETTPITGELIGQVETPAGVITPFFVGSVSIL